MTKCDSKSTTQIREFDDATICKIRELMKLDPRTPLLIVYPLSDGSTVIGKSCNTHGKPLPPEKVDIEHSTCICITNSRSSSTVAYSTYCADGNCGSEDVDW